MFALLNPRYAIQVKQKYEVSRPNIDIFFRESGRSMIALTVREILEEVITKRLA